MAGVRPFQLRKLGHVVLNVTDIEAAVRFYTQVLGLSISDRYPGQHGPGRHGVHALRHRSPRRGAGGRRAGGAGQQPQSLRLRGRHSGRGLPRARVAARARRADRVRGATTGRLPGRRRVSRSRRQQSRRSTGTSTRSARRARSARPASGARPARWKTPSPIRSPARSCRPFPTAEAAGRAYQIRNARSARVPHYGTLRYTAGRELDIRDRPHRRRQPSDISSGLGRAPARAAPRRRHARGSALLRHAWRAASPCCAAVAPGLRRLRAAQLAAQRARHRRHLPVGCSREDAATRGRRPSRWSGSASAAGSPRRWRRMAPRRFAGSCWSAPWASSPSAGEIAGPGARQLHRLRAARASTTGARSSAIYGAEPPTPTSSSSGTSIAR